MNKVYKNLKVYLSLSITVTLLPWATVRHFLSLESSILVAGESRIWDCTQEFLRISHNLLSNNEQDVKLQSSV